MVLHLLRIVLAIILFYIVNWIGERSKPLDMGYVQMSVTLEDDNAPLFNYFFKVLAPVVYIILLAVLFQVFGWNDLCQDIYLIVVYYWAFRFLYITILGQLPLLNWAVQIFYWISSIGLAVWVSSIIDKVETVLPSPEALLEQLWIVIILFLYSVLNKINYSREGASKRIKFYTYRKVDSFMRRYGLIIDEQFSMNFFKAVVYSIMVYEDFNRPGPIRFFERVFLYFSKKPHTYGVMQMTSIGPISDEESVLKACEKIKADAKSIIHRWYDDIEADEDHSVSLSGIANGVFNEYNPGDPYYSDRVSQVYDNIVERFYSTMEKNVPYTLLLNELM